jgi:hypothetical protein
MKLNKIILVRILIKAHKIKVTPKRILKKISISLLQIQTPTKEDIYLQWVRQCLPKKFSIKLRLKTTQIKWLSHKFQNSQNQKLLLILFFQLQMNFKQNNQHFLLKSRHATARDQNAWNYIVNALPITNSVGLIVHAMDAAMMKNIKMRGS